MQAPVLIMPLHLSELSPSPSPLRLLLSLAIALLCLCALLSSTDAKVKLGDHSLNTDPSRGPVLVSRGDKLPLYKQVIQEESSDFVDGVKLIGEWLINIGFAGHEDPAIPPHLDSGEDMDAITESTLTGHHESYTIRRDMTDIPVPASAPEPPQSERFCSRRGILLNKTALVDKCHGYKCYISSMRCDGIFYADDSLYDYHGSMDHCQVLSIDCPKDGVHSKIFSNGCPIQKFLCPVNQTKLPTELGGQSFGDCAVQVYCPSDEGKKHTFYGYEAYDFECTNQQLICNGEVVEKPDGYRSDNTSCVIRNVPCESIVATASSCNQINSTCVTDPTDNSCGTTVDHTWICETNQPRRYANIESITCGSETHHYPSWNGSIAVCTSVRSIKQGDEIIILPYNATNNTYCVLTELDCDGIRVAWNFTSRIPAGCGVGRVVCGRPPAPVWPPTRPSCTSYNFGCLTSATVCTYVEIRSSCSTRCKQPGIALRCDCPVDFTGTYCEYTRRLDCDFNITNAKIKHQDQPDFIHYPLTKNCKQNETARLLGESVCHPLKTSDALHFEGRLNCRFNDGPLEALLSYIVTDFNYTVLAPEFRISNRSWTPSWNLILKVLNFNSFTDLGGSSIVYLTQSQMAGNSSIFFQLSSSSLSDRFKTGGRIRAEVQFHGLDTTPWGMEGVVMKGFTLDDMDWQPNFPTWHKGVSGRIVALVLLCILAFAILCLYVYRHWRKKKTEAESNRY